MRIVIEDDIKLYENDLDTVIYIEHENTFFPCRQWIDFAYILLDEWKTDIIGIQHLSNGKVSCYFHEGSYRIDIIKDVSNYVTVKCIDFGLNTKSYIDGNVMLEMKIEYMTLVRELYNATKIFSKILYKNNLDVGKYSHIYRRANEMVKELKLFLEAN